MAGHHRGTIAVASMISRQRGFALLIVLWTVGFLALLGTQIVAAGRSETQLAGNLKQEAELAAAADGAVARIVFLMVALRDPRFQADGVVRQLQIGQIPVLVAVENENDRINLNTASAPLLRALIINVGAAPALADRLTAAVLDWRTSGASPRPGGAKAADYRAAGRAYGPPGVPFQSVEELADVLGMTPDLYTRLAPHLTVLTDGDPDLSTRDPLVAQALTDAAGVADDIGQTPQTADQMLRLHITAVGTDAARYAIVVVATGNFQNTAPSIAILSRERGSPMTADTRIIPTVR